MRGMGPGDSAMIGALSAKEKTKYGRRENPIFVKRIKKEWDDLKPEDRDKNGNILPNSNFELFKDVYDLEERQADRNTLSKINEKMERKGAMGEIAEAILPEAVFYYSWVAPDVEVFPTNEYDDKINGIDMAFRFTDKNDKYVYLGIDVTTWTMESELKEKRDKIFDFLKKGELGKIKYFEDPGNDVKGQINLPRVVISFKPEYVFAMQDIMIKMKLKQQLTAEEQKTMAEVKESLEKEFIDQITASIDYLKELIDDELEENRQVVNERIKKYRYLIEEYNKILEIIS